MRHRVHPAALGGETLCPAARGRLVEQVDGLDLGEVTELLGERREATSVPAAERDERSCSCKAACDGSAQAAAGAGDGNDPTRKRRRGRIRRSRHRRGVRREPASATWSQNTSLPQRRSRSGMLRDIARVLVTGGTGTLGRVLVPRLQLEGHTVRVLSRSARPTEAVAALEWAQGDLVRAGGVTEALRGVDIVIHAATDADSRAVDVPATERLLAGAREARIGHLVYVSIVGMERIPLPYYEGKLAVERMIEAGETRYSILRATQFPELMEGWFLRPAVEGRRLVLLPKSYRFQLIDVRDVSRRLAELAAG